MGDAHARTLDLVRTAAPLQLPGDLDDLALAPAEPDDRGVVRRDRGQVAHGEALALEHRGGQVIAKSLQRAWLNHNRESSLRKAV